MCYSCGWFSQPPVLQVGVLQVHIRQLQVDNHANLQLASPRSL